MPVTSAVTIAIVLVFLKLTRELQQSPGSLIFLKPVLQLVIFLIFRVCVFIRLFSVVGLLHQRLIRRNCVNHLYDGLAKEQGRINQYCKPAAGPALPIIRR